MQVRELAISGAFVFAPQAFPDNRGLFTAPYQEPAFVKALGHPLRLAQINHSLSRKGTIRGVHFADTPPGQAKYVYCPRGALLDVVVDVRVGSPTFGHWTSTRLDAVDYNALYLAEGLGHAFIALEDDTVMCYLCSTGYNPAGEHGITPLDAALRLPWPADLEQVLSDKDVAAPTLADAEAAGILPRYADCLAYYESLRTAG
jgi:dTDP-4-dehydrorhamnose 3,5-epimerase